MLKKYTGDLTLLAFVFTFVVPAFVGVNTTDASPTRTHRQPYEYDYLKCIRLFRPLFRKVKISFAVEIP